jgi:hypothetical protein
MKKKIIIPEWRTAPISSTCEFHDGGFCGNPTTHAYPAMGGGWMSLCYEHAQQHLPQIQPITELFLAGETIIKRDQETENRMKSRSSGASA